MKTTVRFWDLEPAQHLLGDRASNEAYLAVAPGRAYVLYFPNGGSKNNNSRCAPGTLTPPGR